MVDEQSRDVLLIVLHDSDSKLQHVNDYGHGLYFLWAMLKFKPLETTLHQNSTHLRPRPPDCLLLFTKRLHQFYCLLWQNKGGSTLTNEYTATVCKTQHPADVSQMMLFVLNKQPDTSYLQHHRCKTWCGTRWQTGLGFFGQTMIWWFRNTIIIILIDNENNN